MVFVSPVESVRVGSVTVVQRKRDVSWSYSKHSAPCCRAQRTDEHLEEQVKRRSIMLGSLGLLGLTLSGEGKAADSYYEELLSSSKLSSSSLVANYEKMKNDGKKKITKKQTSDFGQIESNVDPKSVAKKSEKPKPDVSKGSRGAPPSTLATKVGPVGLFGVAGAIALGISSRKNDSGKEKNTVKSAPVKAKSAPPKAKSAPPKAKSAPPKANLSRRGTAKVAANSARLQKDTSSVKKPRTSFGALAGIAAVILVGGFALSGSNNSKTIEKANSQPAKVIKAKTPKKTNPSMVTTKMKEAPSVKPKEKSIEAKKVILKDGETSSTLTGPAPSGRNGVLIIGLLVGIALSGAASGESINPSFDSFLSPPSKSPSPASNEAREWIDAWKAKQNRNEATKGGMTEARAWIEAWRSKQK